MIPTVLFINSLTTKTFFLKGCFNLNNYILGNFSISDIEKFTGIKAHTLRIWEQRYDLLIPKRTDTNFRYYDDDDLRSLLNISILVGAGFRISKIAEMSKEEREQKVVELSGVSEEHDLRIKSLSAAMLSLDEAEFNLILSNCILQMGLEKTMSNIIFPFLNRIGILWITGSIHPAHEHFITNLVRQKLFVAIDGQKSTQRIETKKFLLYLPEGETHEIGLLFANYILRSRGHKVIYLGQMTPEEDIISVFEFFKPDYIFTTATSGLDLKGSVSEFMRHTSCLWPDAQIVMTGQQITQYTGEIPENVTVIHNHTEFIELLNQLEPKGNQAPM